MTLTWLRNLLIYEINPLIFSNSITSSFLSSCIKKRFFPFLCGLIWKQRIIFISCSNSLLNFKYGLNFRYENGRGKWEEGEFPRQLSVSFLLLQFWPIYCTSDHNFVYHDLFSEILLDLLLKSIPSNMLHCDWFRVIMYILCYFMLQFQL